MKTKIFLIASMLVIVGQAFAQHRGKGEWKHHKEHHKQEKKLHKKHDKRVAEYHRERQKDQREYQREMAKQEREYHRELRKRHLEHLKNCHACDYAFYHNDDYYYRENVYYSRRTQRPISVDAEMVFQNGSIRVRL